MNIQELEPLVEANHLRRVLDTQPGCLMRLGADGTVLAANDAALKLIGEASGARVLGRDFSAWVPPDQRDVWTAFTTGVVQGHPASVECDIAAPYGDRQPMLFHGVPLSDHPDGVASMAVAARAVSGQRQLEAAVIELEEQLRERDAERFMARARLAESASSQRELAEKVGEAEAARRAAEAKAAQALADVQQLEVALDGFAARQKHMTAERAAERQRLAEMTEAAASRQEQEATVGALEAALLEAQQALAGEQERGQAGRAELNALQTRLGEALAASQEREAALGQLEAAHASLEASHASLTAEHDRFVRSLRQQVVHLEALANEFPAAGAGADADVAPGDFGTGGEEVLA